MTETGIPGLRIVNLSVHGDSRGWFKENWQREKMCALGIPDHRWVQNNMIFNEKRGVTRGIHAEPWNKFVSVATGSVFGAWVDLRAKSETFGKVYTAVLGPSKAIYVPRGVGISYQALEDETTCTYLVDAHWSAELKKTYTFVNLADSELAIPWPIPLDQCEISEADKSHPFLKDVTPMQPKRTLVIGCNGQLGRAVCKLAEKSRISETFDFRDINGFDFSDSEQYSKLDWSLYDTVINCGAYTDVDGAETQEGRAVAWKVNATGPALLSKVCTEHGITLVHISSDYVFDGTKEMHNENELFSPLSVYGASKAAGDLAVSTCPAHYILRSSWVIGDGNNFVRTMVKLSDRCVDPEDDLNEVAVVDDQIGRLTFTDDMARAIFHLLENEAPYGTYNLTCSGDPASWADIAREVFEMRNGNGGIVCPVTTEEYYKDAKQPAAKRPKQSSLELTKIDSVTYALSDWKIALKEYIMTDMTE